jgi:hypothetical protein
MHGHVRRAVEATSFEYQETDEDLKMIFAPGSSLGGARPKASVMDQHSRLAIARSCRRWR